MRLEGDTFEHSEEHFNQLVEAATLLRVTLLVHDRALRALSLTERGLIHAIRRAERAKRRMRRAERLLRMAAVLHARTRDQVAA